MAMSEDYWKKTKPNGMPDYVWQAQQAALKAEEAKKKAEAEAKKKAEEAAAKKKAEEIKKAAEESAKKVVEDAVNNLLNGNYVAPGTVTVPQEMINGYNKYQNEKAAEEIVNNLKAEEAAKKNNTSSSSTSKANGTSSNDARAEQMAIKNNTTPDYNKDYTGNANNNTNKNSKPDNTGLTTEDARGEKIAIKNNTTPDYAVKDNGYTSVADLNRPTNGSGEKPKVDNSGLTTEDARKEHITVMNDPTLNIPTDGEITLGWIKGDNSGTGGGKGNSSGGNNNGSTGGNGGLQGVVTPGANASIGTPIIPTDTSTTPSGGYPTGGSGGGSTPSAPSSGYYNGANWSGGTSYKPYPTAEEMAGYVSTIIQAAKGELGDVIKPEYMEAEKPGAPELRTLEDLANTFGITYDYDSIYKILNDSVEKQYDAIYQRQKQNEDAYYDNAVAAQNTLLDTLSRDRSNAVSAGVSKGMQAANALGAMLGVSQQFAGNATALSQERSNTAKDYGASLAKAVVDAEATSNERKNAIMEISKMLYGYDSEQYVANMDNYNTILTNNAALQQSYMNNHTALQNALASIFGGVANNKIMGNANVQSSTLAAEAQKYAAQLAAEAQKYAAHQAAEANKQAAATAAQGNVDAYRLYADALVQQALAGRGSSSLGNFEVPTVSAGTSTGTSTGTGSTNVGNSDLTKAYNAVKNYINGTVPTQAMNAANRDANAGLEFILSALGITK